MIRNRPLSSIDWDDPEDKAEGERIIAERQARKGNRRDQAQKDFEAAQLEAENYGMRLRQFSERHYAIEYPGKWRIEIYPGNQRVYKTAKNMLAPFLKIKRNPWGLIDVIRAAAEAMKERDE